MLAHGLNDSTAGFILLVQEMFLLVQISFLRNKLVQRLETCGAPPAQPTHGFHPGLHPLTLRNFSIVKQKIGYFLQILLENDRKGEILRN